MNIIVIVSEIITILLSIYALYMVWGVYKKLKLKLITGLFSLMIIIWVVKAASRILSSSEIIGVPNVMLWSTVGIFQIILFVALFKYLTDTIKDYL